MINAVETSLTKKDLEASLHLMTLKKEVPQRNGADTAGFDWKRDCFFCGKSTNYTIRSIQIVALKFMK